MASNIRAILFNPNKAGLFKGSFFKKGGGGGGGNLTPTPTPLHISKRKYLNQYKFMKTMTASVIS